jgi:hypothetical protein
LVEECNSYDSKINHGKSEILAKFAFPIGNVKDVEY